MNAGTHKLQNTVHTDPQAKKRPIVSDRSNDKSMKKIYEK